MKRLNRVINLLKMEGNIIGRIATGSVIVVGFVIGLYVGRFLLTVL